MEDKYQLPKEFAETWLAALRSGTYKQTIGKYKWRGCFCAMGAGYDANGFKIQSCKYIDNRPCPMSMRLQSEIMSLNDFEGKSFIEIADWIESNVEFI